MILQLTYLAFICNFAQSLVIPMPAPVIGVLYPYPDINEYIPITAQGQLVTSYIQSEIVCTIYEEFHYEICNTEYSTSTYNWYSTSVPLPLVDRPSSLMVQQQ